MWVFINRISVGNLHNLAQIHDRHPIRNMTNHSEIVSDEEIAQSKIALEIHHQVEDLALHGNIESGNRLVADDHSRIQGNRSCNTNALTLATGKLKRESFRRRSTEPNFFEQFPDLCLA